MPWVYHQSSGEMFRDGVLKGVGYSGSGEGKNNPAMQSVHNVGPAPQGDYLIGAPHDSPEHGPYALHLEPLDPSQTHGRTAFLCHGDLKHDPGNASRGCIIMPPAVRHEMWEGNDHKLTVVSGEFA